MLMKGKRQRRIGGTAFLSPSQEGQDIRALHTETEACLSF